MSFSMVDVKKEPVDLGPEEKILTYLKESPKGLSHNVIVQLFPTAPNQFIVDCMNALLKQQRVELLKKGDEIIYRLPVSVARPQGENDDENLVLQIVEEAGNKGIWIKEIQRKSSINQAALTKVLNRLTQKKLIKDMTSLAKDSKRKMYILYSLEPDPCITGGSFYSEQHFDSEFFNLMCKLCYDALEKHAASVRDLSLDPVMQRSQMFLSSSEILQSITDLKISKVSLQVQDIETILQTLVFDGKVEHVIRMSSNCYRTVLPLIETTGLMRMPCGHCLLIGECREGAIISPSTCEYMQKWLEF